MSRLKSCAWRWSGLPEFALEGDGMSALVIDLGGTHLRCAIAHDEILTLVSLTRITNFTSGHSSRSIFDALASQIARYHRDTLPLLPAQAPIVIAFPGPIGPGGQVLDAPT